MEFIYHIAVRDDWLAARRSGEYVTSTLGKKLDDVGYIHMSFAHQVSSVANFIYKSTDDLLILKIDPNKLQSEIKIETIAGTHNKYPHLYGPLNVDAVVGADIYTLGPDGNFPDVVG